MTSGQQLPDPVSRRLQSSAIARIVSEYVSAHPAASPVEMMSTLKTPLAKMVFRLVGGGDAAARFTQPGAPAALLLLPESTFKHAGAPDPRRPVRDLSIVVPLDRKRGQFAATLSEGSDDTDVQRARAFVTYLAAWVDANSDRPLDEALISDGLMRNKVQEWLLMNITVSLA